MSRRSSRSAVTLIELLVALVAAALVITLVIAIFHTVSVAYQGQQQQSEQHQAADALRQLVDDLSTATASPKDAACTFTMHAGDGEPLLELCIAKPSGDEVDLRWFDNRRVTYRIDLVDGVEGLIRTEESMLGPSTYNPAATNMLVAPISALSLEAFDGEQWVARWPTQSDDAWPQAVRVTLTAADGADTTHRAEVLVPLGLPFVSEVKTQATGF